MIILKDFPNNNQLTDGDPNYLYDCVPTTIADALQYLNGKKYTGGMVKDAVYGRDYKGVTAADRYVDYCAAQGVKLFNTKGDGNSLVKIIREQLALGRPTIITEPDPYVAASLGWSHVVVCYACDKDGPGTLTMRDPFGAHDAVHSDDEWAALFEYGEVWTLGPLHDNPAPQKETPPPMTTLERLVAAGWHDDEKADKLTAPNGKYFTKGFRKAVLNEPFYDLADLPLENEHPCDQMEFGNPNIEPGTQQICEMTTWEWTPKRGIFKMYTGQEIMALRKLVQAHEQNPLLPPAIHDELTTAAQEMQHALNDLSTAINRH